MKLLQVGMVVLFLGLLTLIGLYLYHYFKRALQFFGADTGKKSVRIVLTIAIFVLIAGTVFFRGAWAIFILYLLLAAFVMDLLQLIFRKLFAGNKKWDRLYRCGLLPVLLAAAVLCYGYFNMQNIRETDYTVYTEKAVGNYRVAMVSDLHYGTTMDGEKLREQCDRISASEPDIVVLVGDIVDESTTAEQLREAFSTLSSIKNKYGIFYVYGNHDRANYSTKPNFTADQLTACIRENGIHILSDEVYEINEDLVLLGREDAGFSSKGENRSSGAALAEQADSAKFLLLLDHRPLELQENAALGIDLQLSGHTHGGQIWPLGLLNGIFHFNEQNYGLAEYGSLRVIVSSGIAGWGFPIRTEAKSEFVIIDIRQEGN